MFRLEDVIFAPPIFSFQEFDIETIELPDSATKPEPPPRSDSQGIKPTRLRHMVDMLDASEEEEKFSWDSHREYLLTCMGFVNGLGCLLKSATLTLKHGGGGFLVNVHMSLLRDLVRLVTACLVHRDSTVFYVVFLSAKTIMGCKIF